MYLRASYHILYVQPIVHLSLPSFSWRHFNVLQPSRNETTLITFDPVILHFWFEYYKYKFAFSLSFIKYAIAIGLLYQTLLDAFLNNVKALFWRISNNKMKMFLIFENILRTFFCKCLQIVLFMQILHARRKKRKEKMLKITFLSRKTNQESIEILTDL